MRKVTVRLPEGTYNELVTAAELRNMSLSAMIRIKLGITPTDHLTFNVRGCPVTVRCSSLQKINCLIESNPRFKCKIAAIKRLRELEGIGLLEAKVIVESEWDFNK
jgi:ribosomal protein L7/L12